MSINFTSDDWLFMKKEMEDLLAKKRSFLEQPDKTYRELVECRAQVQILKTLLATPEAVKLQAASRHQ